MCHRNPIDLFNYDKYDDYYEKEQISILRYDDKSLYRINLYNNKWRFLAENLLREELVIQSSIAGSNVRGVFASFTYVSRG